MARDSPIVAHCSVDTLYFSSSGDLNPGILDGLQAQREAAEVEGKAVESPWEFDGERLMLRHHGWFSYSYWMSCTAFDVMITQHGKLPALFVQIRQGYLYEVGDPVQAYRNIWAWLSEIFMAKVEKNSVSRLDLCADIIGYREEELHAPLFTTRAREWRTRGESNRVTGLEWGVRGNPVFVRLYDKTLEAVVHRKTWMDRLWLPHGWDPGERETVRNQWGEAKTEKDGSIKERWKREPERVIRLEFELRGTFLDRFAKGGETKALKDPESVIRNAGHIWQYLTGDWQIGADRHRSYVGWLVLRTPSSVSNKTRWPPPAWWEQMAADGLRQARMDKLARRHQDTLDAGALLRQAAGCVAQRAAINGDTTLIEAAQDFAREWQHLLEVKRTTYDQVVEHKRQHRGIKRRPLEKPATAAIKKEDDGL